MRCAECGVRRFHNHGAGEGIGRVRVDAHWLLSRVIRNSLNGSEVLVNHVAFAGLVLVEQKVD